MAGSAVATTLHIYEITLNRCCEFSFFETCLRRAALNPASVLGILDARSIELICCLI
jgi:hypothetical protein